MNKSKFLKKSLAMLLAVMLVVAMIPLGASAANVNDATVLTITAKTGTLEGTASPFKDTFAYDEDEDEELTITLKQANPPYTTVKYSVDEGDEEDVTAEGNVFKITEIPVTSKSLTFYAVKADGKTVSNKYVVNFSKPAPSSDMSLKSAKLDGTIDGKISGETVTFTLPWGYEGAMAYELVMNYPRTGQTLMGTLDEDGTATVPVLSQRGDSTAYSLSATEMECLTALTVDGVAAKVDEEDDSVYNVTLPEGTELKDGKAVVRFTVATNAGVTVSAAYWNAEKPITNETPKFINNSSVVVDLEEANTLTLVSNKETEKEYTVNVSVADSTDATIKSFKASAHKTTDTDTEVWYTEAGTVSGKKLTVTLPYKSDLERVKLAITPAAGATVLTVDGTEYSADTEYNLKDKTVYVVVVAADGASYEYYELSATTAEGTNNNPTITGAVLTIGEGDDAVDYQGVISETKNKESITFTVPYATSDDDILSADCTFAVSFATQLGGPVIDETPFTGTNYIQVESDSGAVKTYSLVFKKLAAETGKDLKSLSFSTANKADNVKADNTYKATVTNKDATGGTITLNLPYSYRLDVTPAEDDTDEIRFYPTFEASTAAAVYVIWAGGEVSDPALQSGYDKNGDALSDISRYDVVLADEEEGTFLTKIMVADETAKVALTNAEGEVTAADLAAAPYKGHVRVYDLAIKFANAETGHTLTSLSADDGYVTSKIAGGNVEITVPASYVDAVPFYADYTASKLATVRANDKEDGPVLPAVAPEADEENGQLIAVTGDPDEDGNPTYKLQVYSNGSPVDVDSIIVVAENKVQSTLYTVTVKAAPAETDALVTSLKVGGYTGVIAGTNITVALPFGTDTTALRVEYTVSKLADHAGPLNPDTRAPLPVAAQDDDGNDLYDVTDPFVVAVRSEDQRTTNVFTVKVTTREQFSDVPQAYYTESVYEAASAGIISGYSDGTFKPNQNITRKQFAAMVARLLRAEGKVTQAELDKFTTTTFTDVPKDYATSAIGYLASKGIINGRGENKFDPNASISRQEAVAILAKALDLPKGATTTSFTDDAKIANYAKWAVVACTSTEPKLVNGRPNGTFAPTENIKRCDVAVIMATALKL